MKGAKVNKNVYYPEEVEDRVSSQKKRYLLCKQENQRKKNFFPHRKKNPLRNHLLNISF